MLNWICPDCGRECSPASRECPACAEQSRIAAQEATRNSAAVRALGKSLDSQPVALVNTAAEATLAQSLNGHTDTAPSNSVLVEERESPEPTEQTLAALVENLEGQVASEPVPASPPVTELDEVSSKAYLEAQELWATQVLDEIQASEAEASEAADQQAIGAIVDSLSQVPETLLLGAAPQNVQPPAPPVTTILSFQYRPAVVPPPASTNQCAPPVPQPILLPGPCLPPDLLRLREQAKPAPVPPSRKLKMPTWVISLLLVVLVVLAVGSFLQNVTANHETKAASVSSEAVSPSPATTETMPADAHPFGRYVEVTGVRVVTDAQRHSQLQYIVVNHSTVQLTGLTLHINVRSTDPVIKVPLIQVSAVIPSLGSYESKEIRTDLDTQLRPSEIPDWDHLKVDVQVTTR